MSKKKKLWVLLEGHLYLIDNQKRKWFSKAVQENSEYMIMKVQMEFDYSFTRGYKGKSLQFDIKKGDEVVLMPTKNTFEEMFFRATKNEEDVPRNTVSKIIDIFD